MLILERYFYDFVALILNQFSTKIFTQSTVVTGYQSALQTDSTLLRI